MHGANLDEFLCIMHDLGFGPCERTSGGLQEHGLGIWASEALEKI
jgi:hypothetical protein